MDIVVVGLSHKTAPIEIRECLAISQDKLESSLSKVIQLAEIKEAVIISTCNRTEIFAHPKSNNLKTIQVLTQFLQDIYPKVDISDVLYFYQAQDAVKHLFHVVCGLDSMVVGETDVLGQVKAAYLDAKKMAATGKITNVLFQRALYVGKFVRTNTSISDGGTSIGNVAVQLAQKIFGNLKDRKVLLIGAGEIAEVTARHLLSQKAGRIKILNRTYEKAKELADQLDGEAGGLEDLEADLKLADVVICSTSSVEPIINADIIEPLMKYREGRSLYFIDIAVPRDVHPDVHNFDNVYVYNIDDLNSVVDDTMDLRRLAIAEAEKIAGDMAVQFHEWIKSTIQGEIKSLKHDIHSLKTVDR